MKSLIASVLILGLVGLVVGVAVQATTTAAISATVIPGEISVTVDVSSFDYGTMPYSTSKESPEITATVGTVNTDLGIYGGNATGPTTGVWTLANTIGADQYTHEFKRTTPNPSAYAFLTATAQTLATGISPGGTQAFKLQITTPSSSTVVEQYTVPVTVQASWGG